MVPEDTYKNRREVKRSMNRLRDAFAPYWQSIQEALFPDLERVLGPLTAKQQQLVQTLEVIRIEQWIARQSGAPGRPPSDRAALARAFVAKAVYDMPTTRVLLDRLDTDVALRAHLRLGAAKPGAERVGLLARLRRIRPLAVAPTGA